jgi:transposase-like protein
MITAFDANDSFGRWSSVATVVGSSGLVSGAGERKTPRPRRKYLVFAGALREGLWLRPCLGHVWRSRINWVLMLKWSLNRSSTLFLCGSRSSMCLSSFVLLSRWFDTEMDVRALVRNASNWLCRCPSTTRLRPSVGYPFGARWLCDVCCVKFNVESESYLPTTTRWLWSQPAGYYLPEGRQRDKRAISSTIMHRPFMFWLVRLSPIVYSFASSYSNFTLRTVQFTLQNNVKQRFRWPYG